LLRILHALGAQLVVRTTGDEPITLSTTLPSATPASGADW